MKPVDPPNDPFLMDEPRVPHQRPIAKYPELIHGRRHPESQFSMSANSPRPWKMVLPLAAVTAAAVLWSIYWAVALQVARGEFAKERARQAEKGITLKCREENWGGYPFRFEYRCANPVAAHDGHLALAATELRAVAMAYKPWHLIAFLAGPTGLTVPGQPPLQVTHDLAQASVIVQSATSARLTMNINAVNAGGLLQARNILISARTSDLRQADYNITATALKLAPPGLPPLSADTFTSQGTISNAQVLVIESATLLQGDLALSASGQMELDELRRPKGQITIKTNNAARLLALLQTAYQLSDQEQSAFAALLAVAGNQLTLTANDGQLFAGPLNIGDLQPL